MPPKAVFIIPSLILSIQMGGRSILHTHKKNLYDSLLFPFLFCSVLFYFFLSEFIYRHTNTILIDTFYLLSAKAG